MASNQNYNVLGISSGFGVSLFPFKERLVANIEGRGIFYTPKCEQWKLNFGKIPIYRTLPPEKSHFPNIDVVISSPDCGSGSIFRLSRAKKLGNHNKNASLLMFFTGIKLYKPKFFYFENLDGLFKSFKEKKFRKILKKYRLVIYNEPVSAWGNSQIHRKRLVIIGIRKDLPKRLKKCFRLPKSGELKTCLELYGDLNGKAFGPMKDEALLRLAALREPIDSVISIHARKKMSLADIRDEWRNRLKGKKRWEVEGGNFSTAPGVYRNMDDDYPATARKANRQFDQEGYTLTPRHLARIQGIPDHFHIHIDPDKPGYWINKGRTVVTKTPPYEISVWFKSCLKKAFKKLNNG